MWVQEDRVWGTAGPRAPDSPVQVFCDLLVMALAHGVPAFSFSFIFSSPSLCSLYLDLYL